MEASRVDRSTILSRYFHEIREFPVLSRDREAELAEKARDGCRESRDHLVRANLSFVVKVASEYRNLGVPFEDLLNEGNLGLIEAARRYDASKGTKFITYAIWWIRKSIFKAISERSKLVRIPSYQLKKVREIRDTEKNLRRSLGRRPSRKEISERLDRSLEKIDQALQYSLREVSLDHRVGSDGDQSISDFLVDAGSINVEDDMIRRESSGLVTAALAELNEQERVVICHRFGLLGAGRPQTLKQIGQMLDLSRERVRQIEGQAKARLRRVLDRRRAIRTRSDEPVPADADPGGASTAG